MTIRNWMLKSAMVFGLFAAVVLSQNVFAADRNANVEVGSPEIGLPATFAPNLCNMCTVAMHVSQGNSNGTCVSGRATNASIPLCLIQLAGYAPTVTQAKVTSYVQSKASQGACDSTNKLPTSPAAICGDVSQFNQNSSALQSFLQVGSYAPGKAGALAKTALDKMTTATKTINNLQGGIQKACPQLKCK